MTRYRYYTAASLDGFLADEHDSLAWLFVQEQDDPAHHDTFMTGIGATVMGATTYGWLVDHLADTGEPWPYEIPCFVFTHRTWEPLAESVRFVSGTPGGHRSAIEVAAAGRDVWVVGGGGLAADLADAGMLDEAEVSIAPVTLGSGRPLLPGRFDLRLRAAERNGAFLVATYDVLGRPTTW
ncbi:dihydrofolate reductase family protein [Nocardioides rubriscoriae]|uniref:dihydrofolate reductase family protein n=1 Tax=Nocardioides rubriscoriae TaxID=642762 RepID=UPI0011E06E06|nr:dihydrofolate reductase family protein [Nocardioides rubriscoriae]